jgi:hypothetical protein
MSETVLCEDCKTAKAEFLCLYCEPNHYFCAQCDYGKGCRMVKHVCLSDEKKS